MILSSYPALPIHKENYHEIPDKNLQSNINTYKKSTLNQFQSFKKIELLNSLF